AGNRLHPVVDASRTLGSRQGSLPGRFHEVRAAMSVNGPPPSGINEAALLRGDHGVISEPDDSNTRLVALVGFVAIICFIIAGLWAVWLFHESRKTFAPDGLPEIPSLITERSYEIGIVNQWDFSVDH